MPLEAVHSKLPSTQLNVWKDDEAARLESPEQIGHKHGFIPRQAAEEISRTLEMKHENSAVKRRNDEFLERPPDRQAHELPPVRSPVRPIYKR